MGHLPLEISRFTKFLLDSRATITATLTSKRYRRSPLVQGGLEIPCVVNAKLIVTKKNKEILAKYLEMVQTHYLNRYLMVLSWVLSWLCLLMKMQTLQTVKTVPNVLIKGNKQIIEKFINT